jgi:hypothetical protein
MFVLEESVRCLLWKPHETKHTTDKFIVSVTSQHVARTVVTVLKITKCHGFETPKGSAANCSMYLRQPPISVQFTALCEKPWLDTKNATTTTASKQTHTSTKRAVFRTSAASCLCVYGFWLAASKATLTERTKTRLHSPFSHAKERYEGKHSRFVHIMIQLAKSLHQSQNLTVWSLQYV